MSATRREVLGVADRHPGRTIRPEAWLRATPRPDLDPGDTPSYANANYIFAGLIVRRAARSDWPRMLRGLRPGLALQPDQTVTGDPARGYFYPDGGTPTPWPTGGGRMVPSTALASLAGTQAAWPDRRRRSRAGETHCLVETRSRRARSRR